MPKLLSTLDLKFIMKQLKTSQIPLGMCLQYKLNYCLILMLIFPYTLPAHPTFEFNYITVFIVEMKLHIFRLI